MSDVYVIGTDMIPIRPLSGRSQRGGSGRRGRAAGVKGRGARNSRYAGAVLRQRGEANRSVGQRVMQHLGQTGIAWSTRPMLCATGATAFREGWIAIKSGLYDLITLHWRREDGRGLLGAAHPMQECRPRGSWGRGRCHRCLPRSAWSIPANTAPPSSSSQRCR